MEGTANVVTKKEEHRDAPPELKLCLLRYLMLLLVLHHRLVPNALAAGSVTYNRSSVVVVHAERGGDNVIVAHANNLQFCFNICLIHNSKVLIFKQCCS